MEVLVADMAEKVDLVVLRAASVVTSGRG